MTAIDLKELRNSLLKGENGGLKEIFTTYKSDCVNFLRTKNVTNSDLASDHFTDAIMVLRENIISGKLTEITNLKNYLLTVCLNLARNERYVEQRRSKKESQVRLLLYDNNHFPQGMWRKH